MPRVRNMFDKKQLLLAKKKIIYYHNRERAIFHGQKGTNHERLKMNKVLTMKDFVRFKYSANQFFLYLFDCFLNDDPRILDLYSDYVYAGLLKTIESKKGIFSEELISKNKEIANKFQLFLRKKFKSSSSLSEEARRIIEENENSLKFSSIIENKGNEENESLSDLLLFEGAENLSLQEIESIFDNIEEENDNYYD